MQKELTEHKGVVGLGVVSWGADAPVHVEGDDMFEAGTSCHRRYGEIRWRTDERFPSLKNSMSLLYVGMGDRGRMAVGSGCKVVYAAEDVSARTQLKVEADRFAM